MTERNIVLQGIVGSTAYGLATPESDIDRLGVYQERTEDLLGFDGPRLMDHSVVTNDPDLTLHELWKFMKLAMAGNPTVTEVLWLPEYEVQTTTGQILVENRDLFLSQVFRKTYGGYALQQLKRLKDRGGNFSSDLRKRTQKHGRHCYRLIIQGTHVLREGTVKVRLDEDEVGACFQAGAQAVSNIAEYERMVNEAMAELDAAAEKTDLPEKPNKVAIDHLLKNLRSDY